MGLLKNIKEGLKSKGKVSILDVVEVVSSETKSALDGTMDSVLYGKNRKTGNIGNNDSQNNTADMASNTTEAIPDSNPDLSSDKSDLIEFCDSNSSESFKLIFSSFLTDLFENGWKKPNNNPETVE